MVMLTCVERIYDQNNAVILQQLPKGAIFFQNIQQSYQSSGFIFVSWTPQILEAAMITPSQKMLTVHYHSKRVLSVSLKQVGKQHC